MHTANIPDQGNRSENSVLRLFGWQHKSSPFLSGILHASFISLLIGIGIYLFTYFRAAMNYIPPEFEFCDSVPFKDELEGYFVFFLIVILFTASLVCLGYLVSRIGGDGSTSGVNQENPKFS